MPAVFSSLSALLLSIGIMTLGYGLLGSLLAVRMAVEEFSTLTAGVVMSCFFLGLMVGSQTVGWVVRRVGHIRTFAALASIFSAATLAHVFYIDPVLWAVLRLIEGYCMAGLLMCAESWLNDRATNETRGSVLSLYMIASYLFGSLGQMLLATGAVEGFLLFALSSVLMSLALVPVALTRAPAPALPEQSLFGLRRLLEISPLGVVGCFVSGLTTGAFYALGPRYGADLGLETIEIAVFMGVTIFGGLLLQWPVGRLSDRIDRRKVISGAGALLALMTIGLAVTVATPLLPMGPWVLGLVLLLGGMMFVLYPLSLSHANDFISAQDFVPASGGLILFYGMGATIGPVAASLAMEAVGGLGLFGFGAVSGLALSVFSLWRLRQGDAVAAEDKTPFLVTPRTAYVVYELDPRAEDDQLSFDFSPPDPSLPEQKAA